MLEIQKFIIENPEKNLKILSEEFGIKIKYNNDKTLICLDYDQIESSKYKEHKLVREARGLVLEKDSWDIVAQSFKRFFNYGEGSDTEIFDWKNFSTTEKIDGSLMRLVGKSPNLRDLSGDDSDIICFTRFSFANQSISDLVTETWSEMALSCLSEGQKSFITLHPRYTFVFEFCSPYTQVVKYFSEPKMIMTGIFDNLTGEELSNNNHIYKQAKILFEWAKEYSFNSIDEILEKLETMFVEQSTDEGFVLKDKFGVRLKIKSRYYLILHRLSDNNNISNLKQLIPVVLSGETDEIEAYFPKLKETIELIKAEVEKDIKVLKEIYSYVIIKESQKDFALCLTKEFSTQFACIFFNLRKEFGNDFTFQQVEELFLKSEELVIKVYKSRGIIKEENEDE